MAGPTLLPRLGPLGALARRRRLLGLFLLGCCVYFTLFRGPGQEEPVQPGRRPTPDRPGLSPLGHIASELYWDRVDREREGAREYDGPVTLPKLAAPARPGTGARGRVLYLGSSLETVPSLIQSACSMAAEGRNEVHLAVFARSPIPLPKIVELNKGGHCGVTFHDGRPDRAPESSDLRASMAVLTALSLLSPLSSRAVLVGELGQEDEYFAKVMQMYRAKGNTVIELSRSIGWVEKVDSVALQHWALPTIEVLVPTDEDTIQFLPQFLQSLQQADYRGLPVPRLVIELPATVPALVQDVLGRFYWPPPGYLPDLVASTQWRSGNMLVLRRAMTDAAASAADGVRTLESFSPAHADEHVFVASPRIRLAPGWWQALVYAMMEYRYGQPPPLLPTPPGPDGLARPELAERIAGITLNPDQAGQAPGQHQEIRPTVPDGTLVFADHWLAIQDAVRETLVGGAADGAAREHWTAHAERALRQLGHGIVHLRTKRGKLTEAVRRRLFPTLRPRPASSGGAKGAAGPEGAANSRVAAIPNTRVPTEAQILDAGTDVGRNVDLAKLKWVGSTKQRLDGSKPGGL